MGSSSKINMSINSLITKIEVDPNVVGAANLQSTGVDLLAEIVATGSNLQNQINTINSGAVRIEAGSAVRDGELLIGAVGATGYDQGDLLAGVGIRITSGSGVLTVSSVNNISGYLTGLTAGTGIGVSNSATAAYRVDIKVPQFNLQSGTGYQLGLTDASNYISMACAVNNFIVVPTVAITPFNSGMRFAIEQAGAGVTALTGVAGVTINSMGAAFRSAGQYGIISLINKSGNNWLAFGDLQV